MKLILHIGAGKTGTSAIQACLRHNAAELRSMGVLVPDNELGTGGRVTGQQTRFFSRRINDPDAARVIGERLRSLRAHMEQYGLQTLAVSAESLITPALARPVRAAVGDLFDVQIVAYVRRQDDFILSSWYQWWLKTHDSFDSYLAECVGKHGDWAKRMAPWEEAFGRARIVMRRFQRSALVDGDVAADFLSVTGLPSRGLRLRHSLANPSVSEHLGALAHRSRDLFTSPHDRGPYGDIDFAAGQGAAKAYRGSILLSLEARQAILAAYEESNRLLRERYFPDLPAGEPLFEPPTAEDVVTLGDTERLQCQEDILFRSVVGLSRHIRRLEGELQTLAKQRRQKKRRKKRPFLRRLLRRVWGNHT